MKPIGPSVAVLLIAVLGAGCIHVGGSGEPPDRRFYDLLPPVSDGRQIPAEGPETILVEAFTVDPGLDREELVWRRENSECGAYENYRWVRPPEEAVRSVLADALRRAGIVGSVVAEPAAMHPDFRLRGHLSRCDEVDDGKAWAGVIEVHLALARADDGEEILRRTYARRVAAATRNPTGVVEAIRKGLDEIAAELVKDLRAVMEDTRTTDDARAPGTGPGPQASR